MICRSGNITSILIIELNCT